MPSRQGLRKIDGVPLSAKNVAAGKPSSRKKPVPDPLAAPGTPVERLFAVLELAAKMGLISAADVVYMLDLPRPTAHRMISSLEGLGFLQKMPVKGKYAVAPKLVSLASSVLGSTIVYAPIQTLLTTIAQRTGETCGIAVMSMGEVEYIASVMGKSPLTLQFQAGQKAPLHCTSSGQVFRIDEGRRIDPFGGDVLMAVLECLSEYACHGGKQAFYQHDSMCRGPADALWHLCAAASARRSGPDSLLPGGANLHGRNVCHESRSAAYGSPARGHARDA